MCRMKIVSIAVSRKKGKRKACVEQALLLANHGIEDDAHAGPWHRQVSFLASESIRDAREGGLNVPFGDFAEDIATGGIDWREMPIRARIRVGNSTSTSACGRA